MKTRTLLAGLVQVAVPAALLMLVALRSPVGSAAVTRAAPTVTLERVPLHERLQGTFPSEAFAWRPRLPHETRVRLANNPLFVSCCYYRARVVNPTPFALRLLHDHTDVRHESGCAIEYRKPRAGIQSIVWEDLQILENGAVIVKELDDLRPKPTVVPARGEALIGVNIFGILPSDQAILPGRYMVRAVLRSPDSKAVYVSAPATFSLSEDHIRSYRGGS